MPRPTTSRSSPASSPGATGPGLGVFAVTLFFGTLLALLYDGPFPWETMFGFRNEGWKPWTLPDGSSSTDDGGNFGSRFSMSAASPSFTSSPAKPRNSSASEASNVGPA